MSTSEHGASTRMPVTYKTEDDGRTFRIPPDGVAEQVSTIDEGGNVTYLNEAAKRRAPAIMRHYRTIGRAVSGTSLAEVAVVTVPAVMPETAIPPRPAMDPRFGDKTPALVEWLRRYAPEEFKERFGVIGEGEYQVRERLAGKTRINTITSTKRGLLARRKTHLTNKPTDR